MKPETKAPAAPSATSIDSIAQVIATALSAVTITCAIKLLEVAFGTAGAFVAGFTEVATGVAVGITAGACHIVVIVPCSMKCTAAWMSLRQ